LIRIRLDMAHIDADVTVYNNHIHITIMGV